VLYLAQPPRRNRPSRDFPCACLCFTSFIPLTRVWWDLKLSSIHIQNSSVLCLHHLTCAQRLGSILSINKRTNCLPFLPFGSQTRPSPPWTGSPSTTSSSPLSKRTPPLPRNIANSLHPELLLLNRNTTCFILAHLQVLVIRTQAGVYLAPPKHPPSHHHH